MRTPNQIFNQALILNASINNPSQPFYCFEFDFDQYEQFLEILDEMIGAEFGGDPPVEWQSDMTLLLNENFVKPSWRTDESLEQGE